MTLKQFVFSVLITFSSLFSVAQITNLNLKYQLPTTTEENSGLLFLNGKIITHNDSGDGAKLYELDSISGTLSRTITITGATNVDWEDITEDATHIYVGDIGNNNGNRQNLKIYKILKSDYLTSTSVTAQVINFSYADQTTFTSQPTNTNFDAEGIVIYQNSILIFSKNWANLETNVYKIPTTAGTHIANKVSTANVQGLITGAVYNDDSFFLTGYSTTLDPFLVYIGSSRTPGDDIFNAGFLKIPLTSLGVGSQIEAITNIGSTGNYYISTEKFTRTFLGTLLVFEPKLYQFTDSNHVVLSTDINKKTPFKISPNPFTDKINFSGMLKITSLEVFNMLGKKVVQVTNPTTTLDLSDLNKGIYFIKIIDENSKTFVKKLIKH